MGDRALSLVYKFHVILVYVPVAAFGEELFGRTFFYNRSVFDNTGLVLFTDYICEACCKIKNQ